MLDVIVAKSDPRPAPPIPSPPRPTPVPPTPPRPTPFPPPGDVNKRGGLEPPPKV